MGNDLLPGNISHNAIKEADCSSSNTHTNQCVMQGLPGGPVVKNPPYNTGDAGLIPGRGMKIPHATGQVSSCATTTELACHNY